MAVTHSTATRSGIADYVCGLLDGGTMELRTSGDVEVATLALNATAFGAASSGTATANSITDDSSATGGTVAKGALIDSSAADRVLFSVTASGGGGDGEISATSVGAGVTVSCSALTYSAPS